MGCISNTCNRIVCTSGWILTFELQTSLAFSYLCCHVTEQEMNRTLPCISSCPAKLSKILWCNLFLLLMCATKHSRCPIIPQWCSLQCGFICCAWLLGLCSTTNFSVLWFYSKLARCMLMYKSVMLPSLPFSLYLPFLVHLPFQTGCY